MENINGKWEWKIIKNSNLSSEEKQMYAPHPGDAQGYGNMFVVDENQKLDWGDLLAFVVMPRKLVNLALWPTTPSDYRYLIITFIEPLSFTKSLLFKF